MTDLSEALIGYLQAAEAYRKAESECGQYNRGYWLSNEQDYLNRKEEQFLEELTKAISKKLALNNPRQYDPDA